MSSGRRSLAIGGLVALLLLVAAASRTAESRRPAAARVASSTTQGRVAAVSDAPATTVPDDVHKVKTEAVVGYGDAPSVPLQTAVTDTNGLSDGDSVSIHVVADKDSAIYAFEAFQCTAAADYVADADVRPTRTGKCFIDPVTPNSDRYVATRSAPPYGSADAVFRVGIGSSSYDTQDGRHITVTCDHSHPCVLVLKLQFPHGYGFQTIPLRFK